MQIEHIALWTSDLERSKRFYTSFFGAVAGDGYINHQKGFESCFLSFTRGSRIEIMKSTTITPVVVEPGAQRMGYTHIAISVGSKQLVDELTQQLLKEGFPILDGPRQTGDGYYESVTLAPDGNRIEITE
jgi:lactoylglutathione lyase